ncbi:MAG: DUF58 domain-containing protein [Candidatus Coatesbacteria bacterium]|nr:DUF58 domain-containing protein [Candidatus Coatesbacteria bacterium]
MLTNREEIIKELDRIAVIARKILKGQLSGIRLTKKRGFSLEFADYKKYVPGDDFRSVDWNIFMRLRELFVKIYLLEEDLTVHVFLDCSKSMDFEGKFDLACRLALAIAYIGLTSGNRTQITSFSNSISSSSKRVRGKGQIFSLINYIDSLETKGETNLLEAVKDFCIRTRNSGLVVFISDFYCSSSLDAFKYLIFRKHDLSLIQILSPFEINPDLDGNLKLIDKETESELPITINKSYLDGYKYRLRLYKEEIDQFSKRYGIGYTFVSSNLDFKEIILNLLLRGEFSRFKRR